MRKLGKKNCLTDSAPIVERHHGTNCMDKNVLLVDSYSSTPPNYKTKKNSLQNAFFSITHSRNDNALFDDERRDKNRLVTSNALTQAVTNHMAHIE
ncbi:hypothetical protein BLOT_003648 [Blomia tropicalis]|nr:hypothetical protein BLOT_003648 [Blomia tropicalis]